MNVTRSIIALGALSLSLVGCGPTEPGEQADEPTELRVIVENVSTDETFTMSDGSALTVGLAPGLFSVSEDGNALFVVGEAASDELETLAELGDPSVLLAAIESTSLDSGIVGDTNNTDYRESPILPGQKAAFVVTIEAGQKFDLAMMLGPSNDTFAGSQDGGIDLVAELGDEDGVDITSYFGWIDAGTEVNEPLGEGGNQPAGGGGIDGGEDEGGVLTRVSGGDSIPEFSDVVRVRVEAIGG